MNQHRRRFRSDATGFTKVDASIHPKGFFAVELSKQGNIFRVSQFSSIVSHRTISHPSQVSIAVSSPQTLDRCFGYKTGAFQHCHYNIRQCPNSGSVDKCMFVRLSLQVHRMRKLRKLGTHSHLPALNARNRRKREPLGSFTPETARYST